MSSLAAASRPNLPISPTPLHPEDPRAVITLLAISSHAESDGPEQVPPSAGAFATLRKASTEAADTLDKRLDAGHDWLYRQLQAFGHRHPDRARRIVLGTDFSAN
jgi:hypothetical protein